MPAPWRHTPPPRSYVASYAVQRFIWYSGGDGFYVGRTELSKVGENNKQNKGKSRMSSVNTVLAFSASCASCAPSFSHHANIQQNRGCYEVKGTGSRSGGGGCWTVYEGAYVVWRYKEDHSTCCWCCFRARELLGKSEETEWLAP